MALIKGGFKASGVRLTDPKPKNLAQISAAPEEAAELIFFLQVGAEKFENGNAWGQMGGRFFPQISAAHSSFLGVLAGGCRLPCVTLLHMDW